MATPSDPLQLLAAAVAAPADSQQQADLLATLRESLEAHPQPLPVLCTHLVKTIAAAGDSVLKRWVLDLLQYAICRAPLPVETRTQLASQSLEVLAGLLNDPNSSTVKVVVQTFATVYPLLFRYLCMNRNARQQWDILAYSKARILEFVHAAGTNAGVRLAAVKFMQRVILVQTRGIADPRLQNKNDPNLSMCPADHPFIPAAALEAEGVKLLEAIITMLYSNKNSDILSAIINSWSNLIKLRAGLVQIVISTLTSWTPHFLVGLPYSSIRSVEKAVRILLLHISRGPHAQPFQHQISEALAIQQARMDKAAAEEKVRRAAAAESRKRPPSTLAAAEDAKRQKLAHTPPAAAALLAAFDFTSLPAALITELIVANMHAFSEEALQAFVTAYRQQQVVQQGGNIPGLGLSAPVPSVPAPAAAPLLASVVEAEVASKAGTPQRAASIEAQAVVDRLRGVTEVKEEPVDPLQMDIDDNEIEYEPDKLNLALEPMQEDEDAAAVAALETKDLLSLDIKIPPPRALGEAERDALVKASVSRIWNGAADLTFAGAGPPKGGAGSGPQEMWMLLIVRMVTRVTDPGESGGEEEEDKSKEEEEERGIALYERQDRLRKTLCDYIMADFSGRIRLATTWMNEEWFNDQIRMGKDPDWRPNYDVWLNQIVAAYQTHMDSKDKTFARFLLDLPSVPADVFTLLRDLCVETDRMQVGFATLRDFVTQRPTLRAEAMSILLELTTHPEKVTRGAAILTVKRWVGDMQPMDSMVREFAVQLLRRLQSRPPAPAEKKKSVSPSAPSEDVQMNGAAEYQVTDENMEDGQLPPEDLLQTPYLPEHLELPAQKAQVLQHVELLFALSTKVPEFLDEIFSAYGEMDVSVQEAIQELITALVRSLGPTHGKLLTLMRTFPPGADTLALRVLNIFTEHGRPSAQLVALVKALIAERDLDARFLIPIIAEMDKADILRHLPKIVSMLNGTPEPKNLVRSVFGAIVTTPPQTFGSVTSNMPRVRQSELLTPAELMVLLHESEMEIGLKSAMEAVGICFSMTDVFRSEILAVVMQQIVDDANLPTLFLRTVIQAVTTYKSLVGFVSTTLLSRLITKKIWTNPRLWDGFIRCAKVVAPASFGALLQLPIEHFRDVADKNPSLKAPLLDFIMKKSGGNKARIAAYLEILQGEESAPSRAADQSTNVSEPPSLGTTPAPQPQAQPAAEPAPS